MFLFLKRITISDNYLLSTKESGYWYIQWDPQLKKKIHNVTWIHMGMFLFKNKDQCELFINKSICRFKYICVDL